MTLSCRSCNNTSFTSILTLGNSYLSEFTKTKRKPSKHPLTLVLCNNCLLVQMKHTTPSSVLYTENYGYKSGINNTMKEELKSIVKKALASSTSKSKNLLVVDIGANDGTLMSFYPKIHTRVAFEPIKKFAKEAKNHASFVINDFFQSDSFLKKFKNKKADIITAISCFYDMDKPNRFLSDITKILSPQGVFIIQQNYLVEMLNKNAFDNIVHEHLEYYSLLSLQNLLKKHNLEVFDVELSPINGGSFRTYIAFAGTRRITKRVTDMELLEKKLHLEKKAPYLKFAKRIRKNRRKLYSFIKNLKKEGKTIYVYGASTRGNTLLQYFKLDNKLISYAVERNPEKWGTYIASVKIPIISEAQARRDKPDYMLVLPWFFKEEFLEREKKYLENGGHFIFPLPEMEII